MIDSEQVDSVCTRIEEMVVRQALDGPQTKPLSEGLCAVGQFLQERAVPQRGLHGTAAALHVTACASSEEARRATRGLLAYLANREEVENAQEDNSRIKAAKLDSSNVIKVSETLFALAQVPTGLADTESLVKHFSQPLMETLREREGWPYFLDSQRRESPDPLPTAYAVRGLSAHGYDVSAAIPFLRKTIEVDSPLHTDIFVRVACLFMLTHSKGPSVPENELTKHLRRLWDGLYPLLDQDLEANIEYSNGNEFHYVRVPWQLYLLASAARLDERLFIAYHAQRRLLSISEAALDRGFIYPHSGDKVSTRTNGILYDCLSLMKPELSDARSLKVKSREAWDTLQRWAGSKWSRRTLRGLVVLVVLASIWSMFSDGFKLSDLGIESLGLLLALIVSFGWKTS